MKVFFTKFVFTIAFPIKKKWLLMRGGYAEEELLYLHPAPIEKVIYIPIPHMIKEGEQVKFRYVLSSK